MDDSSSARIIPLHRASSAAALGRARRLARRPLPPGRNEAAVHPLAPDPAGDSGQPANQPAAPAPEPSAEPSQLDRTLANGMAFLRRRLAGNYPVDEFGFDPDLADNALLPALAPLYDRWFRVEVGGIEHVPSEGGALLVGNHSGGLWAVDAVMTATAVRREHPAARHLRMLAADVVLRLPFAGELARKAGVTFACAPDAERLLSAGELVGVWPEGFKGIGKPFRERYKLQRFGRGGFVHAAVRTGVPIVPVTIIGAEESYPVLGNAKTLARMLDLPYFPLTPTFPWLGPLGLVPLPTKWYIEFGEPIETAELGRDAADDTSLVFDLTDQVRETIQSSIYRLLIQRRSVWR
jgi:1-acyl-sn-glycerol-3-phosphate acyltransferase